MSIRSLPIVCLALLLAAPVLLSSISGHADEPTLFTGSWLAVLGLDTQAEDPREDVGVLRNRLDLDLRHPIRDDLRTRLSARLSHRASVGHEPGSRAPAFRNDWPDLGMRYDSIADLREAYVQWDTRLGQLTVGRDIVQWGALEVTSPLRLMNPLDYSQGLFGALGTDDTMAMADFMIRLDRPLWIGRLQVIYQPFFTQHRFSPFATDTAIVRQDVGPAVPQAIFSLLRRADLRFDRLLGETLMYGLQAPAASPLAGSVAGRWQARVAGWDVGLDAIWNWDRLPRLQFDPDIAFLLGKVAEVGFDRQKQIAMALDDEVIAAQDRVTAAGKGPLDLVRADWQRRLTVGVEATGEVADGLTLRSDLAYAPRIGTMAGRVLFDTQFRPVVTGLLQAGAGLEYQRDDWLVALAECNYTYAMDVPVTTQLFLSARHQVIAVGGLVLRLGEGQPWTLQVGGMYGVTLRDWAVAPHAAYEFAPGWQAGLGAAVAGGSKASPGGLFRTDDQVLLDVRKAF